MKRLIVVGALVVLAAFMYAWAGEVKVGVATVTHTTDTLNDTASGTGISRVVDTIPLFATLANDYGTIYGNIVLSAGNSAARGYGLSDSGYIWLYSVYRDTWLLLTCDTTNSLPTTIHYSLTADSTGADTIIREGLIAIVAVADTLSDSVATFTHQLTWNFMVR